ncbi:hypothetical protein BDY24DRAFT_402000 [Mrakia frigida]|uniref:uncharacterized protein n=1 Tax=Mrakia frigida TaxID=29902 RepID=UPI003FCC0EF8
MEDAIETFAYQFANNFEDRLYRDTAHPRFGRRLRGINWHLSRFSFGFASFRIGIEDRGLGGDWDWVNMIELKRAHGLTSSAGYAALIHTGQLQLPYCLCGQTRLEKVVRKDRAVRAGQLVITCLHDNGGRCGYFVVLDDLFANELSLSFPRPPSSPFASSPISHSFHPPQTQQTPPLPSHPLRSDGKRVPLIDRFAQLGQKRSRNELTPSLESAEGRGFSKRCMLSDALSSGPPSLHASLTSSSPPPIANSSPSRRSPNQSPTPLKQLGSWRKLTVAQRLEQAQVQRS